MKWHALSRRERSLIVVSALVVMTTAYIVLRYLPATRAMQQVAENTLRLKKKAQDTRLPKDPAQDPDQLRQSLKKLEQSLDSERKGLAPLDASFAPVKMAQAQQKLQLEISDLARASGVRVNESLPYTLPGQSQLGLAEPPAEFRRPLQRLAVEASYNSVKQFVTGLTRLSFRVSIIKFEIKVSAKPVKPGEPQPLDVILILAT